MPPIGISGSHVNCNFEGWMGMSDKEGGVKTMEVLWEWKVWGYPIGGINIILSYFPKCLLPIFCK